MARSNEQIEQEKEVDTTSESEEPDYGIEEDKLSDEEDERTYNFQDDIDRVDLPGTFNVIEPNRVHPDDIDMDNLIDAELEEELCHKEARIFEQADPPGFERSNQSEPNEDGEENLNWYPYKNKME
ncbi:hypothetical protein PCASD_15452 [Puccinia coronata f. sp. avenae]|uniref:Uncharacterized protein n=1 Tax=Puccinia coronata f. sp. avenae TaxID=200324 RepID=A0A2N5UPK9_9BASI|nr:hypothetical protein PCASD_15452 [Puccinia coronata f. sp. avenae]